MRMAEKMMGSAEADTKNSKDKAMKSEREISKKLKEIQEMREDLLSRQEAVEAERVRMEEKNAVREARAREVQA